MQGFKEIKMANLPAEYNSRKSEFDAAIQEVLQRGNFIQGKAVTEFESGLANYLQAKHVISCGNGTDALQIALMALEIGRGDEVIMPAFSYVAVIEVVRLLGATPVLVDIEPNYFQIDTTLIEKAITEKTRAIVPVHLFGQCADMDVVLSIAQKYNLYVIEDCAQSIGGIYNKQFLGTLGHIACTSFFPTKNLACYGDGGALITNDTELAKKAKMIASHGQQEKYQHEILGINSRLDTIQAVILNVKLRYLPVSLEKKNTIAGKYTEHLNDIDDIILPATFPGVSHSWHQFTIRVKDKQRASLKKWLQEKGIDSMVYYPKVLNQQKAYSDLKGNYPISLTLTEEVLSLPVHDKLSDDDVTYICQVIRKFYGN